MITVTINPLLKTLLVDDPEAPRMRYMTEVKDGLPPPPVP